MTKQNKEDFASKLTDGMVQARAAVQAGGTFAERMRLGDSLAAGGTIVAVAVDDRVNLAVKLLPLDSILSRKDGDLRGVNEAHVVELANTMADFGLLQFPIVDEDYALLAGAHRVAAVTLLRAVAQMEEHELRAAFARGGDAAAIPDERVIALRNAYGRHFAEGVFVRVFDTRAFPNAQEVRRQVEIIENEFRRDFSPGELHTIITAMAESGEYQRGAGRPVAGRQTLADAVAMIIMKSKRTANRVIDEVLNGPKEKPSVSPTLKRQAEEFSEKLDTKVSFSAGEGQAGKMTIHFASHAQRNALLVKLGLLPKPRA